MWIGKDSDVTSKFCGFWMTKLVTIFMLDKKACQWKYVLFFFSNLEKLAL